MGPFLLIILTLDAHSGSPIGSRVMGDPFANMEECARAAIDQGPQASAGTQATVVFCQEAGSRYTQIVTAGREPLRDG